MTAIHHPKHPAVKILVLATSLAWTAAVQAQSTWYVDDDGPAQLGCTSWEDACSDLQTALGLANSGDEIRVAQGTYRGDATLILGPKMRRDRVVILIDWRDEKALGGTSHCDPCPIAPVTAEIARHLNVRAAPCYPEIQCPYLCNPGVCV